MTSKAPVQQQPQRRCPCPLEQLIGYLPLIHGGRDNPPAPYQTPPKVGAQGQPLAMGSVPVPRPLRALRAGRPPKAALDGQRGGIHLLPGIFRQPVYQVCPQLLESAPEPADPPVKLALVRRAPVLADFLQESGFAGPSQDVPDRRRCRQALVPAFSPL
jgi:hypothetical protein